MQRHVQHGRVPPGGGHVPCCVAAADAVASGAMAMIRQGGGVPPDKRLLVWFVRFRFAHEIGRLHDAGITCSMVTRKHRAKSAFLVGPPRK